MRSATHDNANRQQVNAPKANAHEGAGNGVKMAGVPVLQEADLKGGLQLKAEPVQKQENTTGMPGNLKSGVEHLSGMDLGDVKVHYNSSQPAQLNALAYAQGTDIHMAPGQEQHLPHEAWHVAQQKQGRVQPTRQMKEGVAVNDDAGLEHEANVMGEKALQLKGSMNDQFLKETREPLPEKKPADTSIVQRMVVYSGANPPEDSNIVATLPDTERSAGGPVVHESSNPDYSTDNSIALLAHGGQGSIEWKGGEWDGKKLADDELLTEGRSIQPGSTLELWSCSAGEESDATNDSLVHAVKGQLTLKNVNNVTVKGVKGMHVVLNDVGDHYVPKHGVDIEVVMDVFPKLRAYYLWLWGFFSNKIVMEVLGGLKNETVGTAEGTHPVVFPNNMEATDELIKNLRNLYNAEKECGGIPEDLTYVEFSAQRMEAWTKMCTFLRTNSAFQAITEEVDADWLQLVS